MSASTAHSRNDSDLLGISSSTKTSSLSVLPQGSKLKLHSKSDLSVCENDDPLLRSASKTRDMNSTYVISACKKTEGTPLSPNPVGRLTLQRRATRSKEPCLLGRESGDAGSRTAEARLALQRRTKTDGVEKWKGTQNVGRRTENSRPSPETGINVKTVNGDKNVPVAPSVPLTPDPKDLEMKADGKCAATRSALRGAGESVAPKSLREQAPTGSQGQTEAVGAASLAIRPTESRLEIKVSGAGTSHHRGAEKEAAKLPRRFESLEKRTPSKCISEPRSTPRRGVLQPRSPAALVLRNRRPTLQVKQTPQSSLLASQKERERENTFLLEEETALQKTSAETDPLKVETSQVTVAVRVRPFSNREEREGAPQAVFLDGEEIAVEHPGTRQMYSFAYDLSFWSVDERHPRFASQTAVYQALAAPLLGQAFQGFNTCLFAYGQTGSGKSYTMMGFNEEPGIIPRFCEDLFAEIAKKQTQEVSYHLEMSFFEVYNERIHDLLVCNGENGQRKQTLRVREHPASGPYVEGLSTNVVSSYSDIQVWLQLGNKQKATAATGMNDKSSRSHSVVTLVMTQAKTEFVEGEELDHRIQSRINLVDLAGSERCSATGTIGERLKEGVSINKSLLTLGKVISALSEQAGGRSVFIPYRESVLTWLLKESLSGNSKTAMIATVSPAGSSVEETLSTLRYAAQARSIVTAARVNEDLSARLIRELKAEIEKLKAAQRSSQNIDPERYRLCRQEIASLRMKLHQQEREMADMQRMWKEKLEQAEKRKLQVTKELQKAGITFQMDNHLPNLVNLNEDPQLSEILLYMIKEGTTTVGKNRPSSSHDIQLSGVLIADDHCTITNSAGTVSIVPAGEAKSYINGKLILEPTVLHHGDRVILGGDHYFRFNHPMEVQKGERPPSRENPMSKGPEDFESAKNDLLMAQRLQLEAEIQEAQVRAKEEMMQGIQIVREMAQQELSSQKAAYESKIRVLEAELKEESQRKKIQEINNQKANHKIEELEKAKQRFEQEIHVNRKRLEMEALATKQALEDHRIRHAKILEALETEKQRIAEEVQILQQNQSHRDKAFTVQPSWSSMKLSVMIQEANAISSRLNKNYVFGRHVVSDKGSSFDTCVRVRNLQLGVSTVWSLEKFESKLAAMKELYESHGSGRGEDVFCDPEDEWEPDITGVPVSSFSRRRSRSLMNNRRVSGCLQDIEAHAGQDLRSSRSAGLVGKSSPVYLASAEPFLPGICKELIGSSLELLGQSDDEEGTVADSLMSNFLRIHDGVLAVSRAHEEQDEDSQCNLFTDRANQSLAVQVTSAFEQVAVLTGPWLSGVLPEAGREALPAELRREVRTLGGRLQLFLQGCSSDISPMVKEAQKQVIQTIHRAVACVGRSAALTGDRLHFLESGAHGAAGLQDDFVRAVCDGVDVGIKSLLDSGLEEAEELAHELLRQSPQDEVTKQMKANALGLIESLRNLFAEWKAKSFRTQVQEENSECEDLKKMINLAQEFLKLKCGLEQTIQIIISAVRGRRGDLALLRDCVQRLCSSAQGLHGDRSGSPEDSRARAGHQELESRATSLLLGFEFEEGPGLWGPWEACNQGPRAAGREQPGSDRPGPQRTRGVPKRVYELPGPALRGSEQGVLPPREGAREGSPPARGQ
ncbi:kinesin-like protein KIF14 [Cervus canadensis]|uniref:kinesin-like protein KIF14 n=1 Tax=Cervus canadensis TaxID=1574408 RepID=UPI001C9E2BEB|nr:kinesin-like protein KIF14 [Cervus canadensis]XP_043341698.1 kinesin-like protein KIF14 [Cervus canadensis]